MASQKSVQPGEIWGLILAGWILLSLFNNVSCDVPDPSPIYPRSPTATCNDGSYSYSQNRSGTCSWHGGVRTWHR